MVDPKSKWFPYIKTQGTYFDLKNTVNIPRMICDYLIDAPQKGYTPPDNNDYPRCRLWKYLFHDGAKPLNEELPTIQQKMSVVFNPEQPENPPTEKGYRLIPQIFVKQAQDDAQTRIYVYIGRTVPGNDEFTISLGVKFFIWTHYTYESNTKSDEYSRCLAIEQALIEAFHGVAMEGVGTFNFSRFKHPDCGSRDIFDGEINVGRELTMALEIATTAQDDTDFNNMPFYTPDGKIRFD